MKALFPSLEDEDTPGIHDSSCYGCHSSQRRRYCKTPQQSISSINLASQQKSLIKPSPVEGIANRIGLKQNRTKTKAFPNECKGCRRRQCFSIALHDSCGEMFSYPALFCSLQLSDLGHLTSAVICMRHLLSSHSIRSGHYCRTSGRHCFGNRSLRRHAICPSAAVIFPRNEASAKMAAED